MDVLKYELPDATDYWDGNWVTTRIHIKAGAFTANYEASLRNVEIATFAHQLPRLHGEPGTATLASLELWLTLTMERTDTGKVHMSGIAMNPSRQGTELAFDLPDIDQSFLPAIKEQFDAVLQEFPVRGDGPRLLIPDDGGHSQQGPELPSASVKPRSMDILILAGVAIFVLGGFLPVDVGLSGIPGGGFTYWRVLLGPNLGILGTLATLAYTLGGTGLVAALAVVDLRKPTGPHAAASRAAAAVWSLMWAASMVREAVWGGVSGPGTIAVLVGVAMVLAAAIVGAKKPTPR